MIRRGGEGGMVLHGNYNADSQCCDPRCPDLREATFWENNIDEHWLVVGNDNQPTQYWMSNETEGVFIIDISLANPPFGNWTILDGNHATWSDHEITEYDVDMERQEEAGGAEVVGWNLAATSLEDEGQAEKLWSEREIGRAYLGVGSTGGDGQSKGDWCQESLG